MNPFTNDFSAEVWADNYKDHKDLMVQDTWRRNAVALASVEKTEEDRKYWADKFYRAFEDFKCLPGGRIIANAGTEWSGVSLINCFTSPKPKFDQDSIEGIFEVLLNQTKTLKSEGGWGCNFSFIRPRGSQIHKIGVESPGAVKYMELFDKSSDIITSGSGTSNKSAKSKKKIRKGAMMGILDAWSSDIEEFIAAKLTPGRLQKFNLSVNCSNEFMDRLVQLKEAKKAGDAQFVRDNDKWDLIFPNTQFSRYEEEWNGDIDLWIEKGYPVIVHKTVSLLGLWDQIVRSTYQRNDPGVLFLGNANRTYLANYLGPEYKISSSNPCLAGDTRVKVRIDGVETSRTMKELADGYPEGTEVLSWNTEKKVQEYKPLLRAFCSRKNAVGVMEIEFSDKTYLVCTDDHRIFTTNLGPIFADQVRPEYPVVCLTGCKYITQEWDAPDQDVYDLTVQDNHNFYANGTLVHNCGEQLMPNGSSCDLGTLNLTQFVDMEKRRFDLDAIDRHARIMVRLLDNVLDLTNMPLPIYSEMAQKTRRIGLGLMGWGSALYMLRIRFGSNEATKIKTELLKRFTEAAVEESVDLAVERGHFPLCDPQKTADHPFWDQIELPEEIRERIRKYGLRNSSIFSNQPNGNSGVYANVTSGGIEPVFLPEFMRTSVVNEIPDDVRKVCPEFWKGDHNPNAHFKAAKEGDEDILRYVHTDGTVYKIDKHRGLTKETKCVDYGVHRLQEAGLWDPKADWAVSTNDLTVADHLRDMTEFARFVDASQSKTINLPADYPFEDFENIYLDAYKTGYIKGVTTYRAGTTMNVLAKEKKVFTERPKELPCDVHHIRVRRKNEGEWKSEDFFVLVGLFDDKPIEVFAGKNGCFAPEITRGKIVKVQKHYKIIFDNDTTVNDINTLVSGTEESLARMISVSLQGGVPILKVVSQLEKTQDSDILSFTKSIARALKTYIPNGTKMEEKCPECGAFLVRQEGCATCMNCGKYSKCG